jgi:predicted transcriptional regulator
VVDECAMVAPHVCPDHILKHLVEGKEIVVAAIATQICILDARVCQRLGNLLLLGLVQLRRMSQLRQQKPSRTHHDFGHSLLLALKGALLERVHGTLHALSQMSPQAAQQAL